MTQPGTAHDTLVDHFEQALHSHLHENIYWLHPMPATWAEWGYEASMLDNQWMSWYALPSFLCHLFFLSFLSPTYLHLHLTPSTHPPPPPHQLQGICMQLCYIHHQTSFGLTLDPLGSSSHAKGHHLYTFYILV